MKIHYAPASRAVRSVWLMEEIGLDYEVQKYALGQKEMRSPEYAQINPNNRVPVLIDGDDKIMESTAIAQYLAAKYAPDLARAPQDADYARFLEWLHYAEGMVACPMNNYVVETILLPPERSNPQMAARAMKLINRSLLAADQYMQGREFLADGFTIADTITGHIVIMTRRLGADYEALPNLSAYADRLEQRPAFIKAENI